MAIFIMRFPDLWLFITALFLTAIGLLVVSTVSPAEFAFQWKVALVSIVFSILVTQVDSELLYIIGKLAYVITVIFLLLLLLFIDPVRGSRRWIELGPFTLQVSEFAKLALILFFTTVFSTKRIRSFKAFLFGILYLGIPVILVFLQPDLGSSIILGVIGLLCVLSLQPKKRYLVFLGIWILCTIPIVLNMLAPYQRARIEHFINPTKDPLGSSYNQIQAVIAVGSGQLIGKGLGKGTQSRLQFLPEKQTDFFFATASEQLGFVGSSSMILLYLIMVWRIISLSVQIRSPKARVIFMGSIGLLFFQSMIHIGINIGILPVTGIPLPFLSVGGSSLLVSWICIGLVSSVEQDNRERMAYDIG